MKISLSVVKIARMVSQGTWILVLVSSGSHLRSQHLGFSSAEE